MRLQVLCSALGGQLACIPLDKLDAVRRTDLELRRLPRRLRISEQGPERLERHGRNGEPGSESEFC